MSDTKQPDDPWSRWRKPADANAPRDASPPTAVDRKKDAKPQASGETLANPPVEPVAKPTGTLSVNRKSSDEASTKRRPVRGGALPRKPRPAAEPQPVKSESRRPAPGKPTRERDEKPRRPEWAKSSAPAGAPRRSFEEKRPTGERPRTPAEDPWAASRRAKATPTERPQVRPTEPKIDSTAPPPTGVRLSKVMSERCLCSRREADLWIERGWVFVDGEQISELGTRIDPNAKIEISTEAKKDQAKQVTILLHKPVGYVSGQPEPDCIPAVTLITAESQVPQPGDPEFKPWMLRGLAPAGRLDVDSTGLLVLTSDGRVAKKLIGEDSQAEKEYLVRVSGEMIPNGLELLRHGLELDGKPLKPAWVKQLNEDQLHFILKEGKKRQIRRMCELVGLRVIGLKRVRIGRIRLGDLPMGQWRFLRADEAF
jgi:23S rRNA pseudouridine2604 synthase